MKKDSIYENLKKIENFELAHKYLRTEFSSSSLALDPIWYPALVSIEAYKEPYLSTLLQMIDTYSPEKADFFYAHKDNLSTRKIALLSVTDRLVFQAILNPNVLGGIINARFSKHSYSPKMSKDGDAYLNPYKNYWENFIKGQLKAFKDGFVYYAEFDVERFFDNVQHDILLDILENGFNIETKALDLLHKQLSTWFPHGKGIPQGPEASFSLSNTYLAPLDNIFEQSKNRNVRYFRYNDDIAVMAKSEKDLHELVEKLTYKLIDLELSINSKTRLRKLKNDEDLKERLFTNPYEDYFQPSVMEKVLKIEKALPDVISKLKDFQEIEKKEYSSLKYFLKATGRCSRDYFNEFTDILDKLPSLTPLFSKYLNFYFDPMLHPNFIDNITTIYKTKHLYKYSRFWVAKLIVSLEEIYNDKLEWEFGILNEVDYEMLGIDMSKVEHKVLSFCDTLADENDWVFNSLGISLLTKKLPTEETRDRLFKLLRNTENNYAKTIYLGAITGFDGDYIAEHFEDYLLDCLRSDSIDVQMVALRVLQQAKDKFTLLADTSEFTQRFFDKWEDDEVADEEPKTVSAVTINFNAETTINILDQESMGFDSDKKTDTVDKGEIIRCGHLELLADAGVLKFKTEAIEVSPTTREIRFLEILMSNSPKIVEYLDILRFVYRDDEPTLNQYVDAKNTEADVKKLVQDLRKNLKLLLSKSFENESNVDALFSMIKPKNKMGYKISSE